MQSNKIDAPQMFVFVMYTLGSITCLALSQTLSNMVTLKLQQEIPIVYKLQLPETIFLSHYFCPKIMQPNIQFG
jgi:hypothetical protein